ncbi:nucleotidyltransferase domain-containing protein [Candidatus Lokiarchaeum ossiferum]|uniref:nucleotidyltransferase domain-containing protein n=1 Tax=Candidatus Lokiarchaeum ossiferum TaxID=2951803 RepID=UPI00352F9DF4
MLDLEYCIEGDFIEDLMGNIFEIKGFHQPQNEIVCFIRYHPTNAISSLDRQKINLQTNKMQNYQKIYELSDKLKYVRQNYPEYEYISEKYYFPLQAVPNCRIIKHYKPEKFLCSSHLSTQESSSSVQRDTYYFCKCLSELSQVPLDHFGVTGSTLVGLETPDSDIDILIYGFEHSTKIRECLRQIFENNPSTTEIRPYNIDELRDHYTFRVPTQTISFYTFLKYESRKLHQGKFRNREFFIRFLPFSDRFIYAQRNLFSTRCIQTLGRISLQGQVAGDQNWWTTPSELEITNVKILSKTDLKEDYLQMLKENNLELSDISSTFTLRGRFTENVRLLEYFQARGSLEVVHIRNQQAYLQLSLGSHPEDYLILQ